MIKKFKEYNKVNESISDREVFSVEISAKDSDILTLKNSFNTLSSILDTLTEEDFRDGVCNLQNEVVSIQLIRK